MSDDSPFDPPNLGGTGRWPAEKAALIPQYKDQIVELYKKGIFKSEIAEILGISPNTIHNWREADKEFEQRCKEAETYYVDLHERELRVRSLDGTPEVILDPRTKQIVMDSRYRDPVTGISTTPLVVYRKNDATLQFFLRHNRPEVYGERKQIDSTVSFDSEALAASARAKIEDMIERRKKGE